MSANITGAIIFIIYVLSALYLSITIPLSLRRSYLNYPKPLSPHKKQCITVFSLFALISFSVLSYNMLSYLIVSYTSWATTNHISLPHSVLDLLGLGDNARGLHVWQWLTESTLFTDFAKEICASPERFAWTQGVLVWTMAWSYWMGYNGWCPLYSLVITE